MQRCEVFGKTVSHGNRVSHSHKATKKNLETKFTNNAFNYQQWRS